MPHTETKLESKEIFDGHVIHVTLDTVRLEDGRTSLREIVHHHGGACVLPIDDEGCIYLVRQFRYALGEEIWEGTERGVRPVRRQLHRPGCCLPHRGL